MLNFRDLTLVAVATVFAALLACAGCKGGGSKVEPVSKAAEATQAIAKTIATGGAPVVEDDSFVLRSETKEKYAVGKPATFLIQLKPKGKYHVNKDYPMQIDFTDNPAVALPKMQLARKDAKTFSEEEASFEVSVTPQAAGDQKLLAKVQFAVCTPENCVPDERTLAITLPIQ